MKCTLLALLNLTQIKQMNPTGRTFETNGIGYHEPIHYLDRTDNNEHGIKERI